MSFNQNTGNQADPNPGTRPTPPTPTTRTEASGAGQDAGNSYGKAPEAFSEGPRIAPLSSDNATLRDSDPDGDDMGASVLPGQPSGNAVGQ